MLQNFLAQTESFYYFCTIISRKYTRFGYAAVFTRRFLDLYHTDNQFVEITFGEKLCIGR